MLSLHNKKRSAEFFDGIKMIMRCPVCNSEFKQIEAKVVEENDDSHLVHICCKRCLTSVLAVITMNDLGATSLGLVTDLTVDDVQKFKHGEEVNFDEAIEMHKILETEDLSLLIK